VVKRIDAEEKTAGGIIIPDTAKEKPSQAKSPPLAPVAATRLAKLIPIDIKVCEPRAVRASGSGTEVKIDNQDLLDHEGKRHHGRPSPHIPAAKKRLLKPRPRLILRSRRSGSKGEFSIGLILRDAASRLLRMRE